MTDAERLAGVTPEGSMYLLSIIERQQAVVDAARVVLAQWDECLPHVQLAEGVAMVHGWRWQGPKDGMSVVTERLGSALDRLDAQEAEE